MAGRPLHYSQCLWISHRATPLCCERVSASECSLAETKTSWLVISGPTGCPEPLWVSQSLLASPHPPGNNQWFAKVKIMGSGHLAQSDITIVDIESSFSFCNKEDLLLYTLS